MINVVLVDDEPLMIKTLVNQVPWDKYTMNIISTCSDSLNVIDTVKNQPVDIIFTDIKMPKMDGIELISKIKKINPTVILIVLSSYSDFPLVKKAFKAGASDYILKIDIDTDTMHTLLNKLKTTVLEINNKQPDFSLKKYCCEYLNLHPYDYAYICIMKNISYEDSKIIEKKLVLCEQIYNFHWLYKESCYIIIISFNENSINKLDNFSIASILNTYFIKTNVNSRNLCIGISNQGKVNKIDLLHKQSLKACKLSFYDKDNHLFIFDDIPINNKRPSKEIIKHHILNNINSLNLKGLLDIFELYFSQINKRKIDKILIQTELIDIFTYLIYHLSDINLLPSDMNYNYNYIQNKIMSFLYFNDIVDWILINIKNIIKNFQLKKDNDIVRIIKIYIDQNFTDNLSLNKISKYFGINKSYLSRIFSQELGICFKEYVNALKINKAKNYLHNTNFTISEISQKIGYANVEHFSRTFKSMVGFSPSTYRNNLTKLNI